MSTWTTMYRAGVMLATGVIAVKGWQLYGPTTDEMKTFAREALVKAQAALDEQQVASDAAPEDPRMLLPPVVGSATTEQSPAIAPPLADASAGPDEVKSPFAVGPSAGAAAEGSITTNPTDQNQTPAGAGADPVVPLLTRLGELGGADAQVLPWGSSGGLYRCSCKARKDDNSLLARHFEAVAGEPLAAVEQVVAKVEAWRTEQGLLK